MIMNTAAAASSTSEPAQVPAERPSKRAREEDSNPTSDQESNPIIDDTNKDYQFQDSDITLVSSDDYHFKVHTYQLMAASPVFRDMISTGSSSSDKKEVIFADDQVEDGHTINLFLDICYGRPLILPQNTTILYKLYGDLITFLHKYECRSCTEHLRMCFYAWVPQEDGDHGDHIFRLASRMGDINLAATAIRYGGSTRWAQPEQKELKRKGYTPEISRIQKASIFDLSGMSYDEFACIPDEYKFGLFRACRQGCNMIEPGEADWEEVSEEFKKIMTALRRST
ncbi:hypothetical protein IAT40_002963 [Kwoniella sp. CBS 6097]